MFNYLKQKIIFAIMLYTKKPITLKEPVNITLTDEQYNKIKPYL